MFQGSAFLLRFKRNSLYQWSVTGNENYVAVNVNSLNKRVCYYRVLLYCVFVSQCVWLGSTYNKMVKDYKGMLRKCQLRHGVDRPKTPFSIQDMMEYLEMRRRKSHLYSAVVISLLLLEIIRGNWFWSLIFTVFCHLKLMLINSSDFIFAQTCKFLYFDIIIFEKSILGSQLNGSTGNFKW